MLLDIGTASGFCSETKEIWQFVGWLVTILKIVIPVILVILGIVALGKAVISSDDKEIKTAINGLIKKFIIAVVIFFIPALISALFDAVAAAKDTMADSKVCIKCIASPKGC